MNQLLETAQAIDKISRSYLGSNHGFCMVYDSVTCHSDSAGGGFTQEYTAHVCPDNGEAVKVISPDLALLPDLLRKELSQLTLPL